MTQPVDLIISAYKDDIGWVEGLRRQYPETRLIVYDKLEESKGWIGRQKLDNVGKCDHTYCHHIAEHWYGLADWTVFSTDYPFDNLPPGVTMEGALIPRENAACPGVCRVRDWGEDGRIQWATMTNRSDRNGTNWADRWASGKITPAALSFVEWSRRFVGYDPNGDWPGYSPGGLFAASRKALTYLPRAFYMRLREQLSHSVEPEEEHYLERLWLAILSGKARHEEGT